MMMEGSNVLGGEAYQPCALGSNTIRRGSEGQTHLVVFMGRAENNLGEDMGKRRSLILLCFPRCPHLFLWDLRLIRRGLVGGVGSDEEQLPRERRW